MLTFREIEWNIWDFLVLFLQILLVWTYFFLLKKKSSLNVFSLQSKKFLKPSKDSAKRTEKQRRRRERSRRGNGTGPSPSLPQVSLLCVVAGQGKGEASHEFDLMVSRLFSIEREKGVTYGVIWTLHEFLQNPSLLEKNVILSEGFFCPGWEPPGLTNLTSLIREHAECGKASAYSGRLEPKVLEQGFAISRIYAKGSFVDRVGTQVLASLR